MRRLDEIFQRLPGVATSKDDTATWYVVEERPDGDADAIEPEAPDVPACPVCRGIGFVRRRVPIGHPDFGKATPCVCVEQEEAADRTRRLERYSNLGLLRRM